MNHVRIKKNIPMWLKFALFCIACSLTISFLIYKFIDRIPERNLSHRFLLNNQEIQEQFGNVISVKYGGNGSHVSYKDGRMEGSYSFTIKGTIKEGVVCIQWHSEGSGSGFKVESIELLEAWKQPVIIWSSEEKGKLKN